MSTAEKLGGGSKRESSAARASPRRRVSPDLGLLTGPCGPDCDGGGRGDGSRVGGYFVPWTLRRFGPSL